MRLSRTIATTATAVLALTALTGCPKPPPTPDQNYSDVQFDVTVPPETPVNATLLLSGEDAAFKGPSGQGLELVYQGGNTFTVKARMPKNQLLVYTIRMTAPSEQMAIHGQRMAAIRNSADFVEGKAAFREKRAPKFEGR